MKREWAVARAWLKRELARRVTPEQWKQVKAIVADAMELPADERAPYVDTRLRDDAELRAEVDSLLAVAATTTPTVCPTRASRSRTRPPPLSGCAASRARSSRKCTPRSRARSVNSMRFSARSVAAAWARCISRAIARSSDSSRSRCCVPISPALHGGRERFRREARIAAQLSHPGILSLHTFGEVRGLWYFVMGYVRGATLAERSARRRTLDGEEARRILAEAGRRARVRASRTA